ncbi:protein of unknown function [Lactiplantibacillus plantarum]
MVEHYVRDVGVAGSNPVFPITVKPTNPVIWLDFFMAFFVSRDVSTVRDTFATLLTKSAM